MQGREKRDMEDCENQRNPWPHRVLPSFRAFHSHLCSRRHRVLKMDPNWRSRSRSRSRATIAEDGYLTDAPGDEEEASWELTPAQPTAAAAPSTQAGPPPPKQVQPIRIPKALSPKRFAMVVEGIILLPRGQNFCSNLLLRMRGKKVFMYWAMSITTAGPVNKAGPVTTAAIHNQVPVEPHLRRNTCLPVGWVVKMLVAQPGFMLEYGRYRPSIVDDLSTPRWTRFTCSCEILLDRRERHELGHWGWICTARVTECYDSPPWKIRECIGHMQANRQQLLQTLHFSVGTHGPRCARHLSAYEVLDEVHDEALD